MSHPKLSDRSRALPWLGLLFILIIAALLRLWRIDAIPPGFHFDESFEGLEAWRILTDPGYRPIFLAGNFGVPPLNAYANAFTFGLIGLFGMDPGPTAMRVTAAVFGLLGVVAVYGLASELRWLDGSDPRLSAAYALLAAAFLSVMRWHVHFSRMGIEPVIVPLIWAASAWLLLRGWRTHGWPNFVGCGAILAAGMYTYQGAWVIPFLTAAVAGLLLGREVRGVVRGAKSEERGAKNEERKLSLASRSLLFELRLSLLRLLLAGATALLLVLPLLGFFMQRPDLLFMRPAQLAIVGETGSSADSAVWQSAWATAKMFGPFGQPGDLDPRRNLPGAPALNLWLAIPFYLGLTLALWRLRRPAYAIPLIGLVGLLLPGIFSEYAPHFHRVLGAAAPVALLGGIGLDWIWSRPRLRAWHLHWLAVVLLLLGGISSARTYFGRWAVLPDLYYAFDAGLWEVGAWLQGQPEDAVTWLTPNVADHPTVAFARQTRGAPAPIGFDGRHIFPLTTGLNPRDEAYMVIEHEDFRTQLLLPEVFPAASVAKTFTDGDGNVYARVYTRPSASQAARPPQHPVNVLLGDGIELAGYDLLPPVGNAGEMLYLQLHWTTTSSPVEPWTVFTHVVDPASGALVAGHDGVPGNGSLPTTRWQAGWRVLDEYQIALPSDLAPGRYDLRIGLYQVDGVALPAGGEGLILGSVEVE